MVLWEVRALDVVIKAAISGEWSALAVWNVDISNKFSERRLTNNSNNDCVVRIHAFPECFEFIDKLLSFQIDSGLLFEGCIVWIHEFVLK